MKAGQFIGNNTQMMLKLQTITENLGTACGGRAWVIVTSQEDIDAVLGDLSAKKGQDFLKNPRPFLYPYITIFIQYQRGDPETSARKERTG